MSALENKESIYLNLYLAISEMGNVITFLNKNMDEKASRMLNSRMVKLHEEIEVFIKPKWKK